MFNVARAETAQYFAEETILSGGNVMRHERSGIDVAMKSAMGSGEHAVLNVLQRAVV